MNASTEIDLVTSINKKADLVKYWSRHTLKTAIHVRAHVLNTVPDIRGVARNVILCPWVEVVLRSFYRWGYALVIAPGIPNSSM